MLVFYPEALCNGCQIRLFVRGARTHPEGDSCTEGPPGYKRTLSRKLFVNSNFFREDYHEKESCYCPGASAGPHDGFNGLWGAGGIYPDSRRHDGSDGGAHRGSHCYHGACGIGGPHGERPVHV